MIRLILIDFITLSAKKDCLVLQTMFLNNIFRLVLTDD